MDPQLQQIIDRAIADGVSDEDIDLLVQEHKARAPKPLGPPNQHTATSEEFTTPSFGGFVNNVVEDAKGVLGSFNPMNWPAAMREKLAVEDATAKEVAVGPDGKLPKHEPFFSQPGDRLAAQIKDIPGMVYRNPVQVALAVAPGIKPGVAAVKRGAPAVVSAVKAVAKHPATGIVVPAVGGAIEGGLIGGIPGAIGGAITGGTIGKGLKIMSALKKAGGLADEAVAAPKVPKVDPVAEAMAKANGSNQAKSTIARGMSAAGRKAAPAVDDLAAQMGVDDTKAAITRGMSNAGATAASPNQGGVLKPRATADVVREALDAIENPPVDEVSLPGEGPARGASLRSTEGLADSSFKRTGQDPVTLPDLPEPPKGVDPMTAAMSKAAGLPEAPVEPPTITGQQAAQSWWNKLPEGANGNKIYSPGGVPVEGVDDLIRELDAAGVPGAAPAAAASSPVADALAAQEGVPPAPPTVHRSRSKRPTYTDNDLKAAKDKWGSNDLEMLREKYGDEAVNRYLLEQRAARHQQHYTKAKTDADTKRAAAR